jgi:hypothetical protein
MSASIARRCRTKRFCRGAYRLSTESLKPVRPAEVCAALLAALEAAEGRRRSRKRDQTPDAIGLGIKRELLQRAVQEDPNPEAFEEWLLQCGLASAPESAGATFAMARAIFDEWRLAHSMNEFKSWLEQGAPSDDAKNVSSSSTSDTHPGLMKGRSQHGQDRRTGRT